MFFIGSGRVSEARVQDSIEKEAQIVFRSWGPFLRFSSGFYNWFFLRFSSNSSNLYESLHILKMPSSTSLDKYKVSFELRWPKVCVIFRACIASIRSKYT